VFEEREQQVVSSESVKNTMKLHSNKVKNVLAATRTLGPAANKPKWVSERVSEWVSEWEMEWASKLVSKLVSECVRTRVYRIM
jgi:hypothetical protein